MPAWFSSSFYHRFCPSPSPSTELDLTAPWEQLGLGRSGQSHPVSTSSSGAWAVCHMGLYWKKWHSQWLEKFSCVRVDAKSSLPRDPRNDIQNIFISLFPFSLSLAAHYKAFQPLPSHFLQLHLSSAVLSMYSFPLAFLSPGLFPHLFVLYAYLSVH